MKKPTKSILTLTVNLLAGGSFAKTPGIVSWQPTSWPDEGIYGSQSLYCGMEVFHLEDALIATYVNNPAVPGHRCTAPGFSEPFAYDPSQDYYRIDKQQSYCIISFHNTTTQFRQTCFNSTDQSVESSVLYRKYKEQSL